MKREILRLCVCCLNEGNFGCDECQIFPQGYGWKLKKKIYNNMKAGNLSSKKIVGSHVLKSFVDWI